MTKQASGNSIENKTSNYLYLNSDKTLPKESISYKDIIVKVEKLCTPFIDRQRRRREQSSVARILLNHLIKNHFGDNQASLWNFNKLSNGKPVLEGADAPSISIAHSHDWVTCALSSSSIIGIDIEKIREINWDECYSYVLHPAEVEWVMQGSKQERNMRGLTLWCLKEAAVKALGDSFNYGLSELAFCADGHLLEAPSIFGSVSSWESHSIVIDNDAIMAILWKKVLNHNN